MIVLFFLLSIVANVAGTEKHSLDDKDNYIVVEVKSGDTLWDIAKLYGPEGKDIRRVVHKISLINDIGPGDLRPGQDIKIPSKI